MRLVGSLFSLVARRRAAAPRASVRTAPVARLAGATGCSVCGGDLRHLCGRCRARAR
jgi:hypothetical protein